MTHELSITVTDPTLNSGKATNIPSVWGGKVRSQRESVRRAVASKKSYKSYSTIKSAVSAAVKKSKATRRR